MKNLLKMLMIALVVFSILAVSGCSDNQEETSVEEMPTYVVGTEPTFPPFEMTDDSGDIVGFDIDLIKEIGEDQGFNVEVQHVGFDALIPALSSGNIDIIASGMTITDEREKEVDFSEPYINAGLAVAVASDNGDISSMDDLQGKTAAVQLGSTGAAKANELKDAGVLSEVKEFGAVNVVMMELINGGVDVVINDLPVTEAYMIQQDGQIKIINDQLTSESYGFAVRSGNEELLTMLNNGLQNVEEDGTYDEIQAEYFS